MGENSEKEHPRVFISYSHDSPEHADKVLAFANKLRADGIDAILDQYEESPPEGWPRWMDRHIGDADFVVMVCTETYHKRVMGEEEPGRGRGVRWEGNLIYQHLYDADAMNRRFIPVLFDAGDEKYIPKPAKGASYYLVNSEEGYEGLYRRLTNQPKTEKGPLGKRKALESREPRTDFFGTKVMLAKLPVTGGELFGRDDKLGVLDEAWDDEGTKVLSFVAWGGVGKTALVNEWLNRMGEKGWGGAQCVYGWSFYSQGTKEDRQANSDAFIANALEWFGDKEMAKSAKSAWDKGVRLAQLVRGQKTLLILDGVEPLQYPPGPMAGRLKDQGLQGVLRELSHGMDGLCVITTREKIKDLDGQVGHAVRRVELENLSTEAGIELLKKLGVKTGSKKDFEDAVGEVKGHALALNLLGTFVATVHDGDIRKRDRIEKLAIEEEEKGGHAKHVMEFYERWLSEKNKAEVDILYLMGLFDRPAEAGAIEKLREGPAIEGLTENIVNLSEAKWKYAVKRLRELKLLAVDDGSGDLDCHPLVREHFGDKLKAERPEAWREAHGRLYEYCKGVPEKERPDTLEEMAPLFRAVYHGCAAGEFQEAHDEIYFDRIRRENEYYVWKQLGAIGSWLGVLSCFFDEPWKGATKKLRVSDVAVVLNNAGLALRAVGRLGEAVEPMEAGLEMQAGHEDWENASSAASSLSECYLTLGDVGKAVEYARRGVEYADKSGKWDWWMVSRTALADALHQAGDVAEARRLFEEAERMQQENQPEYRYLYSLQGYQYCDLLVSLGEYGEVKERIKKCFEWRSPSDSLLDIALEHLALGRTWLAEAASARRQKTEVSGQKGEDRETEEKLEEAGKWLDEAVDGLRKA
ncbi:MAG: SEFIR domain-containing protein, partial [Planctomycetota bacterium]